MPTYKIAATCIECATVLQANNTSVTRGHKHTIDKLISGSSLEGKAF